MKNILLISIAFMLFVPPSSTNALTVENISVSDTGGISTHSEAHSSGTSDASAEVRSIIEGSGSNADVHINIKTSEDGQEYATTVEKTVQAGKPIDVHIATSSGGVRVESDVSAHIPTLSYVAVSATSTATSTFSSIIERFSAILAHIFNFVFFFK